MIANFLKRFGYSPTNEINRTLKIMKRNFAAASTGRLYASWSTSGASGDQEIKKDIRTLRNRSRELERNNGYAKKVFGMITRNIVGSTGFKLQAMTKNNEGIPDKTDNAAIENGFKKWSRKEVCDVTGENSFRDICKLAVRSVARDGDVFIRKVYGFENDFKYALQLIEADHLDERYSESLPSGNVVKMGIEYDSWGRPAAYHLYKKHPGDYFATDVSYGERDRIPASEIIHLHIKNRISAGRGIPWIHAAMTDLNMIGGYVEAELTAARVAASKMGFLSTKDDSQYEGDSIEDGSAIQTLEPGSIEDIGDKNFQSFDPTHPTTAFPNFMKSLLRSVASALEVSYNTLANDLENVNFSSMRMGESDPRDVWRDLQRWFTEHFLIPVYEDWLKWAIVSGQLVTSFGQKLPMSRYEKFTNVKWQPRGFRSIDPKEIMYKKMAVDAGLESEMNIISESGNDLEEVYEQLAYAQDLREKYGIKTEFDIKLLQMAGVIEQTKNE